MKVKCRSRLLLIVLLLLCFSAAAVWSEGVKVLNVWTYWGAGAELDAVNAIVNGWKAKNPGVAVEVRGLPSSDELRRQVSASLLGGNPPEVFTSGAGYSVKSWADAGATAPITSVWKEIGGNKIFPRGVASVTYFDNEAWAIPLNIHVLNYVWYNVKVFEKYKISPPKTWLEFEKICKLLKQNGIAPTVGALKGPWAVYTLYPFLIKNLGASGYRKLGAGEVSFLSDSIKKSFKDYKRYWIDNLIAGWSGYNWIEGALPFIEGKAAMYFCMGDWAAPLARSQGMEPIKDIDFFPAPGTDKYIICQIDTFTMAKASREPELAKSFLKYCASTEAQAAFAKFKGSHGANLQTPTNVYSPITLKIHDKFMQPSTVFLPNQSFLISPDFFLQYRRLIEQYAVIPTDEMLDSVLKELEKLRQTEADKKGWVQWKW